MAPTYQSLNYKGKVPDLSEPFEIVCPSSSDVWYKPPSLKRLDAPIIYTTTTVKSFKSVRVKVDGKWKQKYDQGGLVFVINSPDGTRRWIKTGIENLNNEPHISVVATDRWSDWSLRPNLVAGSTSVTVQIESGGEGTLWVYAIGADERKHPLREITWWGELDQDAECWVGVSAAKPSEDKEDLLVKFSDFAVELL